MSPSLKFALLLIFAASIAFMLYRWSKTKNTSSNHGYVRSRRPDESYQAKNDIAKLLIQVLALRERAAKWPEIISTINAADEPQLRTLLLELRSTNVQSPDTALEAIANACVIAKRRNENASTLFVLELAQSAEQLV